MWLVRVAFLRSFFFIYAVAFLVALRQNEALIGDEGLLPARRFWKSSIKSRFAASSAMEGFMAYPSLFWFLEPSSGSLSALAWVGLSCSLFIAIQGGGNVFLVAACWLAQVSIQSVGQTWYGFGWENQLLECNFLCLFLVPWLDVSPFPAHTPTPLLVVWGFRWLLFRIMFGAGLIKIRGDVVWRDLTAMHYHYETQPVPSVLTPFFHHAPLLWHKFESLSNHVIELVLPFLLFVPADESMFGSWSRALSLVGGGVQVFFQFVLICSGNLSFLNWLTAAPAVFCFDDAAISFLFSAGARRAAQEAETASRTHPTSMWMLSGRRMTHFAVLLLLVWHSIPVVLNLLSPRQKMNAAFSPFKIVNAYGAFGSITRERHEVVLLGQAQDEEVWHEYEFPVKPGNINRTPRWISPYHFRADWLLWFAAFQDYQQCPWLVHMVRKLLQNDPLIVDSLLAEGGNPFAGSSAPPKLVKADLYLYKLQSPWTKGGNKDDGWEHGLVWRRKRVREYLPPLELGNPSLVQFLQQRGIVDK